MDPITVTGLTAGRLADALTQVLTHLGTDPTLPFLTRAQITIRDGYVLLAATDRYTLAVVRLPAATGTGRARFTIDGEWARIMLAELHDPRLADAPAVLTLTDATFGIDLPGWHDEDFEPYFDGEWNTTRADTDPDWVAWENITRPLLAAPADPAPVPVRADLLAHFTIRAPLILDPAAPSALTTLTPGPGMPPLAVHSPGNGGPLLLLGPDFLGLLAPYRMQTDRPTHAAPAALDPDGWRTAWADLLAPARVPVPA
jgi:hypothetical protein